MRAYAVLFATFVAPLALAQQPEHDEHAHHRPAPEAAPTESELRHVPPDPPQHFMEDMSPERMIELMAMDDGAVHSMLLVDQLEWANADEGDALGWEVQAWLGDDYDKVWIESEGERLAGGTSARNELMWDHVVGRWWNVQAGVRHDVNEGPSRTWAAFGLQGLAPYWWEIEATFYVGEQGRTALRLGLEYDLLLTQRLKLQPELELTAYGKSDEDNGVGSGLAEAELGLRLRYEVRRELAPYIGLQWERKIGDTADFARDAGGEASELVAVAGLRVWF